MKRIKVDKNRLGKKKKRKKGGGCRKRKKLGLIGRKGNFLSLLRLHLVGKKKNRNRLKA